jgi:hypothetical protein
VGETVEKKKFYPLHLIEYLVSVEALKVKIWTRALTRRTH